LLSVAEIGLSETRCEFCGVALEALSVFQDVVINKPCGCFQAVANQEEAVQLERNQEAQKKAFQEKNLTNSIRKMFGELPEKFRDRTFETFKETAQNRAALQDSKRFSDDFPEYSGLLFMGPVGTGKTHLAAAIAHEQIKKGRSVLFGTVPSLLSRIKATYSDDHETEREVMSVFFRCSLLVLDDLGKEKVSEWVEERLYEIVNGRYERNLPIVITTNVGLKAVKERYQLNGAAIVSRLHEMCPRGVMLNGPDYRMKKGNN
jgi:DNA replication protein DnaC